MPKWPQESDFWPHVRRGWTFAVALMIPWIFTGCLGNKVYNKHSEDYLIALTPDQAAATPVELAIIEFDEFGTHWNRQQLEDTLTLLARRS